MSMPLVAVLVVLVLVPVVMLRFVKINGIACKNGYIACERIAASRTKSLG
jgi:hypothetical protein